MIGDIAFMIAMGKADMHLEFIGGLVLLVVLSILLAGFYVVQPNVSSVLVLFGNYKGSERRPGLWWANPFMSKQKVSLRVRNFESAKLKVNDHDGNPIEIAAVVVWRVVDTAEALFQVDNYDNFVHVQSEAALRNLATSHPYDAHQDDQLSLRGNTAEVAEALKIEIQNRLEKAGVEVIEARISHMAYAPEIANAMLRRQQAAAVISARSKIVEGAVSMVEMALDAATKGLPEARVLARQDAWEAGPAIKKADEILKAHPDIDIIFAANEGGTIGAQLAIKNAGKGDKVKVFGTDAAKQEIDMLLADDGILQAVTGQQPYDMGVRAIMAAVKAVKGQAVDKTLVIPGILLTRSKPQSIATFKARSGAQ